MSTILAGVLLAMLTLFQNLFLFVVVVGGIAVPFSRLARRYTPTERMGTAVAASLVTIYLVATLLYLLGADYRWNWLLPAAGLLGAAACRRELRDLLRDADVREAGIGWILLSLWCVGFAALITSYVGGSWSGDWHEHYERACFFLERWPADYRFIATYPLPARPPLANLVTSTFLALGEPGYPSYQTFNVLLCTLTYFPLAAICRLFGAKPLAAALLAPALMLNPFFLQNSTFAWTKLPAAFFVLASIPPLVRSIGDPADRWHLPLALTLLAAGILTHYSAAVWLVALGAGWLAASLRMQHTRGIFHRISLASLAPILLLATWFGWSVARYGPAVVLGSNTTVENIRLGGASSFFSHFGQGLLRTLVPTGPIGPSVPWMDTTDPLAAVSDRFFHLYQESLALTLGTAGLFVLLISLVRPSPPSAASRPNHVFWWVTLVLAVLLGVGSVAAKTEWGLVHISLQPMVLLGLGWLVVKSSRIWLQLPLSLRALLLAFGLFDLVFGVLIPFWVQNDAAARFHNLSFPARANFAGKLRLGQPFLADNLALPTWLTLAIFATLFGLAYSRIVALRHRDKLPRRPTPPQP